MNGLPGTPVTWASSQARAAGSALTSVGLVLLASGATVGVALFGTHSWLTWLPLGAGATALAGSAVIALVLRVRGAALARGFDRARARLLCEVALVALLVVLINALAVRSPLSIDVTSSARNTLAEASVAVTRALVAPVLVQAALPADDRAYTDLDLLVARYREHSEHISLVRAQPRDGRSAVDEAKVTLSTTLGGEERRQRVRFTAGSPDQEQQLTNALRAVSSVQRPRAYVLAGHGEPSVADEGPAGLRRFGQALADEGFAVVPLPLASLARVPEDASVVVAAAPEPGTMRAGEAAALTFLELERLHSFLDGGGRLLVLLEPRADTPQTGAPGGGADAWSDGLAALLGSVGVQTGADVVIDASAFSGLLGGPQTATGVAYASHPVTSKLGGSMTHFPRARSLAENPMDDVIVTALVQTGTEAFGETSGETTPGRAARDEGDVPGPMTLAMAVERTASATSTHARVVVVGDSTFASNAAVGLGANLDFAVNALLWLANEGQEIALRPRGRSGNLLLLSPTSRERIAFVLLYGLPVLLLGTGLTIRALRRRS